MVFSRWLWYYTEAETTAHSFRNLIESNDNPKYYFSETMVRNEFNLLNRETMLNQVFITARSCTNELIAPTINQVTF